MLTREIGVFTAYICSRPAEPRTPNITLEGPALVLAEAERSDCAIARVYISRLTEADLIWRLETVLAQRIPIIETSAAELSLIASSRPHGGVVAVMGGRPRRRRSRTERGLWSLLRFGLDGSVRSPNSDISRMG